MIIYIVIAIIVAELIRRLLLLLQTPTKISTRNQHVEPSPKYTSAFGNRIPVILRDGDCALVTDVPPEAIVLPDSVIDRICERALHWHEYESQCSPLSRQRLRGTSSKMTAVESWQTGSLYLAGEGRCEIIEFGEEVPEDAVKIPESVIEFLGDEILRHLEVKEESGNA
ncbi:hypothetical protein ABW21_db0202026 [Orbilia brochopaga]|nr:hypothetical protein ABW21_db0202026 [Drechslerella brochopaga]